MDLIIEFVTENFIWIIVGGIVILMAIVGYVADKTDFGRNKIEKQPKPEKEKKVKEKKETEKISVIEENVNDVVNNETVNNEEVLSEQPIELSNEVELNNIELQNEVEPLNQMDQNEQIFNETNFEQPLTTEINPNFSSENNKFN